MKYCSAICLLSVLLIGCQQHPTSFDCCPCVEIPEKYHHDQEGVQHDSPWWENFADIELNYWEEEALAGNLDLSQTWQQLIQARAEACIQGSEQWPQVNLNSSVTQTETSRDVNTRSSSARTYLLQPKLTYEVDLWRRIDAQAQSAQLEACATYEDYLATQLVLSGTVGDLWLTIREQNALRQLLDEQILLNETLLELVELRFSVGEVSALDVYQQKQQLAATKAAIPSIEAKRRTSWHKMYVLTGRPPEDCPWGKDLHELPKLPPFPALGSPAYLLERRPDLRAAHLRVVAADYEVAQAVADLFPSLSLELDYQFSATDAHRFFEKQLATMAAKVVAPILDGGRRRCEVHKQKSALCEELQAFSQTFLTALLDVENAIIEEECQLKLLDRLEEQLKISQATLNEARWRYMHGVSDFLPVLAAVSSLQNVQQRMINERKTLLTQRSALYRALGG